MTLNAFEALSCVIIIRFIHPSKFYVLGKHLYTLTNGENEIHALAFSPNRYWLCAACGPTIKIWDLEGKALLDELRPELINLNSKAGQPECLSLAWSPDGQVSKCLYVFKVTKFRKL